MVSQTILTKLKISALSSNMMSKHASVLIYKGKDVCYGYNHFDSRGLSRHAELDAIIQFLQFKKCSIPKKFVENLQYKHRLCKDLSFHFKKIKIIVVRFSKNSDNFIYSAPCVQCKNILQGLGFNKIKYSTDSGNIVSSKFEDIINHHSRLERFKIKNIHKCSCS